MAEEIEPTPGGIKWALEKFRGWSDSFILEIKLIRMLCSGILWDSDNHLLSHNILHTIMFMLERYKLSGKAQLLLDSKKMLQVICRRYDEARRKLVQMGIMVILSDILKREFEKQMGMHTSTETIESTILLGIISEFLPALEDPRYHDITSNCKEILCKGTIQITREERENSLKFVFPRLLKICQAPYCPTSYKILLLKMIYIANGFLSNLVKINELIGFTKNLIDTNPVNEDNIVIGFVIANLLVYNYSRWLISERMNKTLNAKKSIVLSWPRTQRFITISNVFFFMATFWLSEYTISNIQIDERNLIPRIETINSTLNRIMPDIDNGKTTQMSLNTKYHNLREMVKNVLNLPDISRHKGKLTASTEGIRKFNDLVTFIVKTTDALIIDTDFLVMTPDLCDLEDLPVPKCPTDIILELYRSASFDRVLGSSQSPVELKTNPLLRALRLLSILYEVNENWGILFGSLSTEKLIDRSCFNSKVLKEVINRTKVKETNHFNIIPSFLRDLTPKYPFLILMEQRQHLMRTKIFQTFNYQSNPIVPIVIPRKNLLNEFTKILDLAVQKSHERWGFQFEGEPAAIMGSSKEFFSVFSRDCLRFSHGLWSGEAGQFIDGVSYVNSQSGLFPLPNYSSNPIAKSYLNTIGVVMAKAVTDCQRLDINFSHAFYKCLFKKNLDAQQLSLVDIKDVMPSIFKFVESLVDVLREKWYIRNNNSLTIEEQNQSIFNITCDGCSFEDLCVNFTLPGFPDIEMMEGGRETLLSIDNLENYLKLLIWWLLYANPKKSIKEVRNGFERVLDPSLMQYFYPNEYEGLICGLTKELWTVDILKQNCLLVGFTVDSPVVHYLFEVLSSLSADDQRHFLQFVTATPRLPVGGLAALNPKLTIRYRRVDGNPDNYLPGSFTCVNNLYIVGYSCKEALEVKLLLAIREGRNLFSFI